MMNAGKLRHDESILAMVIFGEQKTGQFQFDDFDPIPFILRCFDYASKSPSNKNSGRSTNCVSSHCRVRTFIKRASLRYSLWLGPRRSFLCRPLEGYDIL
jgi:hypothetical protein